MQLKYNMKYFIIKNKYINTILVKKLTIYVIISSKQNLSSHGSGPSPSSQPWLAGRRSLALRRVIDLEGVSFESLEPGFKFEI